MSEDQAPYSSGDAKLCDGCIWSGKRVEATHTAKVPGGPRRIQTMRLNRDKSGYVKGPPIDGVYYFCAECYQSYLQGAGQRDNERHAKWLRDTQPCQLRLF